MTTRTATANEGATLDIVWAIVLLQGGFLVLGTIESFVVNATQGFVLFSITILTAAAASVTLLAARGLRRRKRWAKRVTIAGEWFVLVLGGVELAATQIVDPSGIDLVPLVTGVVMPMSVLMLLHRAKGVFTASASTKKEVVV